MPKTTSLDVLDEINAHLASLGSKSFSPDRKFDFSWMSLGQQQAALLSCKIALKKDSEDFMPRAIAAINSFQNNPDLLIAFASIQWNVYRICQDNRSYPFRDCIHALWQAFNMSGTFEASYNEIIDEADSRYPLWRGYLIN